MSIHMPYIRKTATGYVGMGGSIERYSNIATQEAPSSEVDAASASSGTRDLDGITAAEIVEVDGGYAVPTVPTAVAPRDVALPTSLSNPHLYFNRELSWIDFNWRVLAQVADQRVPLLERARYLAIVQSNLDEFFAKRVGGLKRQKQAGVTQLSPDGRTPDEQLQLIRAAVLDMQHGMADVWCNSLEPELKRQASIHLVSYHDLCSRQRRLLHDVFRASIYPILTPLAVDPAHPFPFISNLSHSLAVVLRHPVYATEHFARVKIPTRRSRWLPLEEPLHFMAVEELVRAHVDELFPGMEVIGTYLFRVTRNADMARQEDEASDLVQMISEELRQRRFAPVVRLEIESTAPADLRDLLRRELEVTQEDEYLVTGLQDFSGLAGLANLDIPQHRFDGWDPVVPGILHVESGEPDVFAALRAGDLLVHHPYDSFTSSVQRFIEAAADDPCVLAIKQTLYRTSEDSPIVRALMRAAENGKQVAVLIEVTATYDEARNISWAEQLEDSGAHVIYGVLGLKTHAKVALVVREEESRIRTYCHIGTGNYHPTTARLYTDLGLLTASDVIGQDAVNLFHSVTGYATAPRYNGLIVAPHSMRRSFEQLIEREIEVQSSGGEGRIIAKMNAIDDAAMIKALYHASQQGVSIDLIVRGHTHLRPGLPGISENIRLISIIGRFLEHDRIFWFGSDGAPRVFFGSADWRQRNLDERVEAVVEITDPDARSRLTQILEAALRDNTSAWDMGSDGCYRMRSPGPGEPVRAYQQQLMQDAKRRRAEFDEVAGRAVRG
jgi:polyphosphate kinase